MPSRCSYCLPSLKKATMMKEFIPGIVKLKKNLGRKGFECFWSIHKHFPRSLLSCHPTEFGKIAILAVIVIQLPALPSHHFRDLYLI